MRILAKESAAIVTDMQEKLMAAMWNEKSCEDRASMLIKGLKILDVPTIIMQQYTKGLGNSLPSIYEAAGTTEYFEKHTFSGCTTPEIMDAVKALGRKNIFVMGTEAHVCVLQTCIDLKDAGFQPILVVDAIASRKESDMDIAIKRAIQEGILVTTAETALFELTVDSKNPAFKEISKLVK